MNTIFYQLRLALQHGASYTLVVDSLPLASNEMYTNFIKSSACKAHRLFVTDDLYAMLGGDDKLFSALVGNAHTVMILHILQAKAQKNGRSFLDSMINMNVLIAKREAPAVLLFNFSSSNNSRSINIAKSREFIVKPEQLMRMSQGEAYIRMADDRQIAHLIVTE